MNEKLPFSIWEPVAALVVFGAIIAVLLCGCQSTVPGRFVGAEWDSRSPEQLAAGVENDTAVYSRSGSAKAQEARAFTEWKALFDMISGLRVRLRFFCAEWGCEQSAK